MDFVILFGMLFGLLLLLLGPVLLVVLVLRMFRKPMMRYAAHEVKAFQKMVDES